ncbi:TetR/AcrR family transcriptional regulator [Corynebacterium pseudopelargi]|uniref:Transcriptional regulator, TetR family n=1 Tax=Corynebacterium pseudopelargi TaxID=2080757 RepID=A0A3G6ISQ8_9CORY|nr:TetR/AcrR family transcriptional regulator [Corynebacterium pseudopelargi]AZA08586.1 Transcriptional regulator, TetR family [Corynebacterium pseudopelargi]
MTPAGPGRKTGPKPKFSTHDVVDAALSIGIDRFTMNAVATQVGVGAPSLYRLFASRDDLVGACLQEILARNPWQQTDLSWPDKLKRWSRYCWDVCEAYPGLALTLYTYPFPQVHGMRLLGHVLEDFEDSGLDRDTVLYALDFIGDTAITLSLGLQSYRIEPRNEQRNKLLAKNRELLEQNLPQEITKIEQSQDLYQHTVAPKTEFIIAALQAGIRPDIPKP